MTVASPRLAEIDLYTWTTPNGRKVSILLEELQVPYEVHSIDIEKGEQFQSEFLKISPNNKIPAIVDRSNRLTLMESGAILLYLADKYRKFIAAESTKRWQTIEWLNWQVASMGPMLGQAHHFRHYKPGASAYATDRYTAEAHRLYNVLDQRLAERQYIVDDYSIADIAVWPWISRFERQGINIEQFTNVKRWYLAIGQRRAVEMGYNVPHHVNPIPML